MGLFMPAVLYFHGTHDIGTHLSCYIDHGCYLVVLQMWI